MLYQNILETIGSTPLVKLNKINKNKKVNIYLKLEGQNPGGSVKDRIALAMIENAEATGKLTKDKIIMEATSGNTGIALAMVGTVKGYKVKIVMPENFSLERKKMIRAFGAELILTPANQGTDGSIVKAKKMADVNPRKYWLANQFGNPYNPKIHYSTTAEEILRDLPEITNLVVAMGTSGTLVGISKKIKEKKFHLEVTAVEPILGHKIQGLKNMSEAIVPEIYDKTAYDEKITVTDEQAYQTAKLLAKEEGIFAGMSAGAVTYVALEKAKSIEKGNMVVIIADRGEKYLSTDLYD